MNVPKRAFCTNCIVAMLVACCIALPGRTVAQGKKPVRIKLANSDSSKIPLKQILADPVLTAGNGCDVTSFTISFVPDGGEYKGPFVTSGSRIKENQYNYLKEFTNMNVRIFIEDVHIKCNGTEGKAGNLLCVSVP